MDTDTAYFEVSPMATMLIAREVPPFGGDTLFASVAAAWEALSPGLRAMLALLWAVNSSAKADVSKIQDDHVTGTAPAPRRARYSRPSIR